MAKTFAIAGLLWLAIVGCSEPSPAPLSPGRFPSASPIATAAASGYEVSDVRLVTVRDPVVFWQVSFDARWLGPGEPAEARCRWRLIGSDRVPIVSGGIQLEAVSVDDEIAVSVYPDEIPGVPREAALNCD
jgi:hypothetical protein